MLGGMIAMLAIAIYRVRTTKTIAIGPPLPPGSGRKWSVSGDPGHCFTVEEVAAREGMTRDAVIELILAGRFRPEPVELYEEQREWVIPKDYVISR